MKHVSDEQLENWFSYHQPTSSEIVDAHQRVRNAFMFLAKEMNALLPEGPDKTVTLRAIRDASMQANATIACAQRLYEK